VAQAAPFSHGFDFASDLRHNQTMRAILALCLIGLAPAASAQAIFDLATGQFGSASDPATSCAANPHEMSFEDSPPHLNLTWQSVKEGPVGRPRTNERFDIEGLDDRSMTLREEGDYRPDRAIGPFWVLQFTETPAGYCWRRPEWPEVRCEDQQLRCENATS
jgi:hypothetical protein